MKIKEVRELETKDLAERLQSEIAKYNHSISPLENPSEIRTTRRNIARMKTVLRLRELNKE